MLLNLRANFLYVAHSIMQLYFVILPFSLKSVQEALQDKQQELEKLDALHIACIHQNEIFKTQIDE